MAIISDNVVEVKHADKLESAIVKSLTAIVIKVSADKIGFARIIRSDLNNPDVLSFSFFGGWFCLC